MTPSRSAGWAAAVLTLVSLSGCTVSDAPRPTAGSVPAPSVRTASSSVSATSARPRLLTSTRTANNAGPDALVSGTLAVNDAGCVIVGPSILFAPPGSSVLADGSGVALTGRGEYRFGQSLQQLRGGFADIVGNAEDPPGIAECRSRTKPEREYAVVMDS